MTPHRVETRQADEDQDDGVYQRICIKELLHHNAGSHTADCQQRTGRQVDTAKQDDTQHTNCHQCNDRHLTEQVGDVCSREECTAGCNAQRNTQDYKGEQRP